MKPTGNSVLPSGSAYASPASDAQRVRPLCNTTTMSSDMIRLLLSDGSAVGRKPVPKSDARKLSEISYCMEIMVQYGPEDAWCQCREVPIIHVWWDTRPWFDQLSIMPWEWEGSAYIPATVARDALRYLVNSVGIQDQDLSDEVFAEFFQTFPWHADTLWDDAWIRNVSVECTINRIRPIHEMTELTWTFVDPSLAKVPRTAHRCSTLKIPTILLPLMFRGILADKVRA